jgi:hypothetical protein
MHAPKSMLTHTADYTHTHTKNNAGNACVETDGSGVGM